MDWQFATNYPAYSTDGHVHTHGGSIAHQFIDGEEKSARSIAPPVRKPNIYLCSIWSACRLSHHTFGNGEFDIFCDMVEPMVCSHFVGTCP